jgi:hypothetical protein
LSYGPAVVLVYPEAAHWACRFSIHRFLCYQYACLRYSSVGWSKRRGSIPSRAKRSFFPSKCSGRVWGQPNLLSNGNRELSSRG